MYQMRTSLALTLESPGDILESRLVDVLRIRSEELYGNKLRSGDVKSFPHNPSGAIP